MELVSERSEKDIAADCAMIKVDDALRRFAANVMRVAAGAGKPCDLVQDASAFITACVTYDDATGRFPSDMQLDAVLRPKTDSDRWERLSEESIREDAALSQIDIGVLRAVAARLVGQRTQESNALHLIYKGVNSILDLRREREERNIAQRRAEVAASRKPRKPVKAKRGGGRRKAAKGEGSAT